MGDVAIFVTMIGQTKFPWLSLLLIFLTYGVFGWYVSEFSVIWSDWLIHHGKGWGWAIEENLPLLILEITSSIAILLVTLCLAAPVAILSVFLKSWVRSDLRAFASVLVWSLLFVIILRWFVQFTQLLVLMSATILARVELQRVGYRNWSTFGIILLICISGFAAGSIGFYALLDEKLTLDILKTLG